jgi:deoxycytidine triphosphate deaminase
MLLNSYDLMELKIVHIDQIQDSLVYVHLDCTLLIEQVQHVPYMVNLKGKEYPGFIPLNLGENGYALKPNQFALASTMEIFNLPKNVVCEFKLDQRLVNVGLTGSVAHYDSSWNHMKLTFGLKNQCEYHSLLLKSGMEIGQVFFYDREG